MVNKYINIHYHLGLQQAIHVARIRALSRIRWNSGQLTFSALSKDWKVAQEASGGSWHYRVQRHTADLGMNHD